MTRYRKSFFILLIAAICVPIALNFLCLTVFPAPLVGDGKVWLGFWGSYLGGIITVLSTIYVLDRNHNRDCNRKEYEIQKAYFDSLCTDMGKLCSSMDTDILCFYLMNIIKIENSILTIREIGAFEKGINCQYNEFCLKYAHYRGQEGDAFISTFYNNSIAIGNQIFHVQEAVINRQKGDIKDNEYKSAIRSVCTELEKLGDIRKKLLMLAESWKEREWKRTEELRRKFINE